MKCADLSQAKLTFRNTNRDVWSHGGFCDYKMKGQLLIEPCFMLWWSSNFAQERVIQRIKYHKMDSDVNNLILGKKIETYMKRNFYFAPLFAKSLQLYKSTAQICSFFYKLKMNTQNFGRFFQHEDYSTTNYQYDSQKFLHSAHTFVMLVKKFLSLLVNLTS